MLDASEKDFWGLREGEGGEYGFCHNDLSQHNVIVDSRALKIAAIINWEYVGFWPEYFEGAFYERPGLSAALDAEVDDVPRLLRLRFLADQDVE